MDEQMGIAAKVGHSTGIRCEGHGNWSPRPLPPRACRAHIRSQAAIAALAHGPRRLHVAAGNKTDLAPAVSWRCTRC